MRKSSASLESSFIASRHKHRWRVLRKPISKYQRLLPVSFPVNVTPEASPCIARWHRAQRNRYVLSKYAIDRRPISSIASSRATWSKTVCRRAITDLWPFLAVKHCADVDSPSGKSGWPSIVLITAYYSGKGNLRLSARKYYRGNRRRHHHLTAIADWRILCALPTPHFAPPKQSVSGCAMLTSLRGASCRWRHEHIARCLVCAHQLKQEQK